MVERYATVVDVEKHANTLPKPLSTEEYQRIHVWGPVLEQYGKCVGALGEAGSVCLNIISLLPSSLMDRVKAFVPEAMRPMPGDTAFNLMHRIRDDPFFEPMMVHKGGCGPQRVQLKGTTYSQPRRKSWSVIDGPDKNFEAYMDEETGEYVYDAFNYTAHGRLAEDWKAYPMPLAVWDLGVAVWNIALPFLRGHSATVPPNACQLCAYYTLFGGAIQRHRDNFTTEQMIARLEKNDNDVQPFHEWVKTLSGSHHGGDANSQVLGSYVLVFTYGDAGMDFKLSFPPQIDPSANRKEYKVHPLFTVRLSHGTLFIFSPEDDVYFCHEAAFPMDADGYRHAFVFRWLSSARQFYLNTSAMKLSDKLVEKKEAREAAAAAKKKREREATMALVRVFRVIFGLCFKK